MDNDDLVDDTIKTKDAMNVLHVHINNRLGERQRLWEKIVSLDGEISGLREAQYQLEKLQH